MITTAPTARPYGTGGHGSQQVIFDPAGSFRDPRCDQNAVMCFTHDRPMIQGYKSVHAAAALLMSQPGLQVATQQAETDILAACECQTVRLAGRFCANATSLNILYAGFQGFERHLRRRSYLQAQRTIRQPAGVKNAKYYENDEKATVKLHAVQASFF